MFSPIKLVKALGSTGSGLFQKVRCVFFGKVQNLRVLNMYGISFNPPDNSFGVSFSANNDSGSVFVLLDRPDKRFIDLAKGELKIGNYLTEDYVHFKADGTITIHATTVNVEGDVVVTGTVTANNFITGAVADYNAHVHSGVEPGPSNTGGPV